MMTTPPGRSFPGFRLQFTLLAFVCSVQTVFPISGFAQTNTLRSYDAAHSSLNVTRVYTASSADASSDIPVATNVMIASPFRSVVETMLRRSPTFRRQYLRLANSPMLTVDLRAEPARPNRPQAFTVISRTHDGGRIQAVVFVCPSGQAAELIAHEIEHVIEQLDGVNLNQKASLRGSGVHECDCGAIDGFETSRAIAAGVRVAREVGERQ